MARHIHGEGYEGHDFARFTIVQHPGDSIRPHCGHCGKQVTFTVMWRDGVGGITVFLRGLGIDYKTLIIKDHKTFLGVECGCYAKLNRQIAHIHDAMKKR